MKHNVTTGLLVLSIVLLCGQPPALGANPPADPAAAPTLPELVNRASLLDLATASALLGPTAGVGGGVTGPSTKRHRRHKFFFLGYPIAAPMGNADEIYLNCYYGDNGPGHVMGVHSFGLDEEGAACGEGSSASCTGTMNQCDCLVGLYATNCD